MQNENGFSRSKTPRPVFSRQSFSSTLRRSTVGRQFHKLSMPVQLGPERRFCSSWKLNRPRCRHRLEYGWGLHRPGERDLLLPRFSRLRGPACRPRPAFRKRKAERERFGWARPIRMQSGRFGESRTRPGARPGKPMTVGKDRQFFHPGLVEKHHAALTWRSRRSVTFTPDHLFFLLRPRRGGLPRTAERPRLERVSLGGASPLPGRSKENSTRHSSNSLKTPRFQRGDAGAAPAWRFSSFIHRFVSKPADEPS